MEGLGNTLVELFFDSSLRFDVPWLVMLSWSVALYTKRWWVHKSVSSLFSHPPSLLCEKSVKIF